MGSPYYRFASQGPRYGFDWWPSMPGGIWRGYRAAENRGLGVDPIDESMVPPSMHFPALADYAPGYTEIAVPSGPEPLGPDEIAGGLVDMGDVSDMTGKLLWLGVGAVAYHYLLGKGSKKRRRR